MEGKQYPTTEEENSSCMMAEDPAVSYTYMKVSRLAEEKHLIIPAIMTLGLVYVL